MRRSLLTYIFAIFISLIALLLSQVIWITGALRQKNTNRKLQFQECFDKMLSYSIFDVASKSSQPHIELEPLDSIPKRANPERITDLGQINNYEEVGKMLENALLLDKIDKGQMNLYYLDSLIRERCTDLGKFVGGKTTLINVYNNTIDSIIYNKRFSEKFLSKVFIAERTVASPKAKYTILAEYRIAEQGTLRNMSIAFMVSIAASIVVVLILFLLSHSLKKRHDEISNMERSFHGAIHDLKSPLAFVFFQLSLLEEDESDMIKKSSLSLTADRVNFLSDKIMRLLKSAQRINKINEAEKKEVSLYDMLEQIGSEMRTMFPQKKIIFEYLVDADFMIYVLPDLIEASIRIIIENAVKFSGEAPVVVISAIQDVENIKISISDNGVGMSSRQMRNIFKPYFSTDTLQGNGIGLYYAQSIVKAHNGKISVKSEVGNGSEFIITLPNR